MKVLFIVPSDKFRDEELFHTKEELEKENYIVELASTTKNEITGRLGGKVKADILLKDVNINNYKALVLIGGMGATEYWNDKFTHDLLKKAHKEGKLIGAICIAPRTLANAGMLKGKKFNSWESEVENIKKLGGIHIDSPVVIDSKIVTGNGPTASREFGKTIASNI